MKAQKLTKYMKEICFIADPHLHYNFLFIKRDANNEVDSLEKHARYTSHNYVAPWITNV